MSSFKANATSYFHTNKMKNMAKCIKPIEEKIFNEKDYCLNQITLIDCPDEDLKKIFGNITYNKANFIYGALLEVIGQCSGTSETPLTKYYFSGM